MRISDDFPSRARVRTLLVGVRGHGGEEVYSRALAEAPPRGVEVSATFDHHSSCAAARCPAWAEIALNRLAHPWLRFDLGFRVLRVGAAVDLVHVHSHPTLLLARRGRPVVFSAGSSHYHYVRDYEGWSEARIRARYARARALYSRLGVIDGLLRPQACTLVYTFSHWARRTYLDFGASPQQVRVLYPGFDVPSARTSRGAAPLTFLFLGRQPRRKGGDAVLGAFAALRAERGDGVRLLYVSDELPAPVPDGVDARPLVPPGEVGALYAAADVFVNPTRAEGFGFTNAEAQGHALPVISSRLGAVPEVVADGVTGLLLEPDDARGLLQAMHALVDAERRATMGAAARERFLRLFARPVFQAGLRGLYDEALAMARATAWR